MTHNYNFDRPPHVISVTFNRDHGDLPISFYEAGDDDDEEEEIRVKDVAFLHSPVEEGDLLVTVDVNGHSYQPKDLLQYKLTGVMTLRFKKNNSNANQHIRGAFFVQPQAHTCLPMSIDFQKKNGVLSIVAIDKDNTWLSNTECCLQEGQSVVAINGTPCHQLEDEDALMFIKTKLDMNPYLYITITTLPPEAMTDLLTEEEETLNLFVMGLVTLKGNKMGENPQTSRVGDYNAIVTAKQLFVAIQKSLARIQIQNQASGQSLGRGLHAFCQRVLSEVLQNYSVHLNNYLPSPTSVAQSGQNPKHAFKKLGRNITGKAKPTASWAYKYRIDSDADLTRLCQVIATCEYCANQSQALQEMLQELQETRNLELTDPIECFHDVVAKAISILVSGIMQRLKDGLWDMRSINYRKIKTVEVENQYVHTLAEELETYLKVVGEENLLPRCYLRSFCDKLVLAFCEVYYDLCLHALKSISKRHHATTIQQLLMDVYHLKQVFLNFPEDSASFKKLVDSSFRSVEALLKGEWQLENNPAMDNSDDVAETSKRAKDMMMNGDLKDKQEEEDDRENIIRVNYSKLEAGCV